jgi:hypothetical protein
MKKLLMVVFALTIHPVFSQEAEVRKSIETFFEGLHKQDTLKIRSVFAKQMVLHSVSERKSGAVLSVESADQIIKSISGIPKDMKIEEKLLSWKVSIDGSMAHVWTPYEFYVNGKLSHSGVNSFQLFNDNGQWKITYCIDTRKR